MSIVELIRKKANRDGEIFLMNHLSLPSFLFLLPDQSFESLIAVLYIIFHNESNGGQPIASEYLERWRLV